MGCQSPHITPSIPARQVAVLTLPAEPPPVAAQNICSLIYKSYSANATDSELSAVHDRLATLFRAESLEVYAEMQPSSAEDCARAALWKYKDIFITAGGANGLEDWRWWVDASEVQNPWAAAASWLLPWNPKVSSPMQ